MNTINPQEDFLRALDEDPRWLEAVRSRILDDELRQLPTRFNAFVERTEVFMASMQRFVEQQSAINDHLYSASTAWKATSPALRANMPA